MCTKVCSFGALALWRRAACSSPLCRYGRPLPQHPLFFAPAFAPGSRNRVAPLGSHPPAFARRRAKPRLDSRSARKGRVGLPAHHLQAFLNAPRPVAGESKQPFSIAAQDFFFVLLRQSRHRLDSLYRFGPCRHRVAVIKIAADDDVVIGPALDRFRQIGFPRDGGDIELVEVFAWSFFEFLLAVEELFDRR